MDKIIQSTLEEMMKFAKADNIYAVRLFKGEKISQTLVELAKTENIATAHISGIGGVCNIELGFFDTERRDYDHKVFEGTYELLNLTGNITLVEDSPFLHAHVTLGNAGYHTFGGHLFEATIAVTGEFFVTPFGKSVSRAFDKETQLKLMEL